MSTNCFISWQLPQHCPHCLPVFYCAYCSPVAHKPQVDRKAEIEMLRSQLLTVGNEAAKQALENRNLRAALEKIAEAYCCNCFSYPCTATKEIARAAIRALKDKP